MSVADEWKTAMIRDFVPPHPGKRAFTCPHCGEYAQQSWSPVTYYRDERPVRSQRLFMSVCYRCRKYVIWRDHAMIYPEHAYAPPPAEGLSRPVRDLYLEAASLVRLSPRAAAAILRVCLRELCKELDAPEGEMSQRIAFCIQHEMGPMPLLIQQFVELVSPLLAEASPPELIHLDEDPVTAYKLFDVINLIGRGATSRPIELQRLYNRMHSDRDEER